ncbi:M48 family metallopeptidase [Pseudoalteromonas tunicata]|uniref:M48 family metallopeptidase n=1 Tax=Pseudoalteromonas tunicata TaxID=314281 RepID=UPI00273FC7A2|nr:M48 family metallopeptidase [Pseudoalteromonas tunicata]MDP4982371.1 M48 family metallopeptidase [Pseudoalteromonas tunicata]MDP5213152.1 M48 family metallopeptidase [Pseudoalteromonas tunicata]
MKNALLALAITGLLLGCKTSPTGRTQLALYSDSDMNSMGVQSFSQLKKQMAINTDTRTNRYVQCIADNIIAVLPQKYASQKWEVVVFDEDSANAFALPGGKIGVHTGLLKVAVNQHQVATVMGHEVGHVIAEHSNERASQSSAIQIGMQAADATLKSTQNQYHGAIMTALGVGTQYGVILPFSRTHESEADEIGLDLMAKAGFDPKESVTLWQNMSAAGSGASPEFLSTHPSPKTRIEDLRKEMPEAMKLHYSALQTGKKPGCTL